MATTAHHVHLPAAAKPEGAPRWKRWLVLGLTLAAIGCITGAFFQPWWHFTLYAPQYPHGLNMEISLQGVTGDVSEIDELNHYIGMAKLEGVAPMERHFAPTGVVALVGLTLLLTFAAGRKSGWLILLPAVAFPLVFMADAYYWLHLCGHALDKHAPIHLPPFTPQMFGNGMIGQFYTFAQPSSGFYMACAGALLVIAATVLRQRSVCASCSRRGTCGFVCKQAFLGKEHA